MNHKSDDFCDNKTECYLVRKLKTLLVLPHTKPITAITDNKRKKENLTRPDWNETGFRQEKRLNSAIFHYSPQLQLNTYLSLWDM